MVLLNQEFITDLSFSLREIEAPWYSTFGVDEHS
jgi:hypothetical protein